MTQSTTTVHECTCDRCGETTDDWDVYQTDWNGIMRSEDEDYLDLCAGCWESFERWFGESKP